MLKKNKDVPARLRYRDIAIKSRKLNVKLAPEKLSTWCGDAFLSHWFNALSSLFPIAENSFITALRAAKGAIENEGLLKQIDGYVRQEASHTKMHQMYNMLLSRQDYNIACITHKKMRYARFIQHMYPLTMQLARIAALEYYTAIFADIMYPPYDWLARADRDYALFWKLHAIEEVEHKSVAFDVYQAISGNYFLRILMIFPATIELFYSIAQSHIHFLRKDKKLWRMRTWQSAVRFFCSRRGILWLIIKRFLLYLLPNFHPWQIDNYHLVVEWDNKHA